MRDIIAQLGAKNHDGIVSLEHLPQGTVKNEDFKENPTTKISQGEMSTKKINEKSAGKESWEIDSGAHDLNCDPTLQQIMSVAGSKGQSRTSNFLELANTVSGDLCVFISFDL